MAAGRDVVHDPRECDGALTRAFGFLGKRWNGVILAVLMPGPAGFAELKRAVNGISDSVLSDRLTELGQAGLVERSVSDGPPVSVSYDLARLARNGLIARDPGRNRYALTRDGLLFACFYTRVYDHVLRPLMAPDRPNAPPELTAALTALEQLAAAHVKAAHVPVAA